MILLFKKLCTVGIGSLCLMYSFAAHADGVQLSTGVHRDNLHIQQEHMHEPEILEPLRMQVFQLNHVQAQAIMDDLAGTGSDIKSIEILSERGAIILDTDTNKLIVTDIPSRLELLASVIVQIDVPVRQVMIEARFVDVRDGWGINLDTRIRARLQDRDSEFVISVIL